MKKTLIKWGGLFIAAVVLVSLTAFLSFQAAHRSFEDEFFLVQSNKISFNAAETDEALIAKFKEVKRRIETDYYLDYQENDLVEGAIKGMVEGLNDPYTKYYTAQQMRERNDQLQGEYIGTGIEVSLQNGEYILVGSVKEDTPAAYAGIKAGDRIVAVNSRKVSDYEEGELWALFAEKDSKIALSMLRGEESVEAELIVSNIVEQSVFSEMLDSKVGYVRIAMFDAKVAKEFDTEVDALLTKGMQSLILDLRHNGGGLASEMSRIADSILPDGKMMYYEVDREQNKKQIKYSDAKALNIPIVVLVNGNTASASELLASMLRDSGMAKLVGMKTYGKAVSQITIPFSDGTGLVLTVSQYYTESGYNIQGNGLIPDVEIAPMEEYKNTRAQYIPREDDVQLKEAVTVLAGMKNG